MKAKKVNAQYFNDLTQNIEYFIRTNSSKGNPQKFTGFTLGHKSKIFLFDHIFENAKVT